MNKMSIPFTGGLSVAFVNMSSHVFVMSSSFPLVPPFKHTHPSFLQAVTDEFALLHLDEFQDTQITQRCIYGICLIHEVKIMCNLDKRQLDN